MVVSDSSLEDEHEDILVVVFDKKSFTTKVERYLLGQTSFCMKDYPFDVVINLKVPLQPPPSTSLKYLVTGTVQDTFQKSRDPKVPP